MPELDASYSGITKMIDDIGPEETLRQLQEEWALQLSRKETAEKELKQIVSMESIARTGLANFAKALIQRKIKPAEIIRDINLGEAVRLSSVNQDQVITILVNVNTTEARKETFKAFNLARKEDRNV